MKSVLFILNLLLISIIIVLSGISVFLLLMSIVFGVHYLWVAISNICVIVIFAILFDSVRFSYCIRVLTEDWNLDYEKASLFYYRFSVIDNFFRRIYKRKDIKEYLDYSNYFDDSYFHERVVLMYFDLVNLFKDEKEGVKN